MTDTAIFMPPREEAFTITIVGDGDDVSMQVDPPTDLHIIAETLIETLVAQSRRAGMSHALIARGFREAADEIDTRDDDGVRSVPIGGDA